MAAAPEAALVADVHPTPSPFCNYNAHFVFVFNSRSRDAAATACLHANMHARTQRRVRYSDRCVYAILRVAVDIQMMMMMQRRTRSLTTLVVHDNC
jgi:hypothetical protein